MKQDCVFCKIVAGEIPSSKIYEDKNSLAFLDISPINKGHTLLIPKEHYEDLFDFPEDKLKEFSVTLKKVSKVVLSGVKADGLNIGMNNKSAAGQIVFHAHFHLIPRYKNDGLKSWPQDKYENTNEMNKYKEMIAKSFYSHGLK